MSLNLIGLDRLTELRSYTDNAFYASFLGLRHLAQINAWLCRADTSHDSSGHEAFSKYSRHDRIQAGLVRAQPSEGIPLMGGRLTIACGTESLACGAVVQAIYV